MQKSRTLSKTDVGPILRQLSDLPGYGNAHQRLRDLNLWDVSKDPDYSEFTVYFECDYITEEWDSGNLEKLELTGEGHAVIYARDMIEAEKMAKFISVDDVNWYELSFEEQEDIVDYWVDHIQTE